MFLPNANTLKYLQHIGSGFKPKRKTKVTKKMPRIMTSHSQQSAAFAASPMTPTVSAQMMRPPVHAPARSPVKQRLNHSSNNSVSPSELSKSYNSVTTGSVFDSKRAQKSPDAGKLSFASTVSTFGVANTGGDASALNSGHHQSRAPGGLPGVTSRSIRIVSAPPDVDYGDIPTIKTSPIKMSSHDATSIVSSAQQVAMSREELEKHLEMKTSAKTQFMSLEKTPHILPENIFNDNSNSW